MMWSPLNHGATLGPAKDSDAARRSSVAGVLVDIGFDPPNVTTFPPRLLQDQAAATVAASKIKGPHRSHQ
jgi:hypothetical protein